jgi:hypothetical protein
VEENFAHEGDTDGEIQYATLFETYVRYLPSYPVGKSTIVVAFVTTEVFGLLVQSVNLLFLAGVCYREMH